jgi:hypothetical protein
MISLFYIQVLQYFYYGKEKVDKKTEEKEKEKENKEKEEKIVFFFYFLNLL